jgi:hypothetical protein
MQSLVRKLLEAELDNVQCMHQTFALAFAACPSFNSYIVDTTVEISMPTMLCGRWRRTVVLEVESSTAILMVSVCVLRPLAGLLRPSAGKLASI